MTLCQETNRGSDEYAYRTGHARERDIVIDYIDVNTMSIHLQIK